jgi:hypothetical protein
MVNSSHVEGCLYQLYIILLSRVESKYGRGRNIANNESSQPTASQEAREWTVPSRANKITLALEDEVEE